MKTLVSAAVFAALSSSVVAETVIYIGGKEYDSDEFIFSTQIIDSQSITSINGSDSSIILRGLNGVETTPNGGIGQTASTFFRGTESNHALVLMNGVQINDGISGQASIQFIVPAQLSQASVIKGPNSSSFGDAAIGGVINFDTSTISTHDLDGIVNLETGSNNTHLINISKAHAFQNKRFKLGLAHIESEGIPTKPTINDPAGFENSSLTGAFELTQDWGELSLSHWQAIGKTEYQRSNAMSFRDHDVYTTSLKASGIQTPLGALTASFNRFDYRADEELDHSTNTNNIKDFSSTTRNTVAIELANKVYLTELTTSLVHKNESIDYDGWQVYSDDFETYEGALNSKTILGSHQLNLGARVSHDDYYGSNSTWAAAYAYKLSPNLKIKGAISTGFKVPSADERSGTSVLGAGNTNLQPEESLGKEIGFESKVGSRLNIAGNFYTTEIKNLIEAVGTDLDSDGYDDRYDYYNRGKAKVEGFESEFTYRHTNTDLILTLQLQDAYNVQTGARLLKRAEKIASLKINHSMEDSLLSTQVMYSGDRKGYSSDMSAYTIVNASYLKYLSNNTHLKFGVENLFDKNYELAAGYNTYGTSLNVGLIYTGF